MADLGGKVVGAVWMRIMDDYGHVDDDMPLFAISLYKEYRRQGIERASLAVQKANYAVKMFIGLGFKTLKENEEEDIMVCEL